MWRAAAEKCRQPFEVSWDKFGLGDGNSQSTFHHISANFSMVHLLATGSFFAQAASNLAQGGCPEAALLFEDALCTRSCRRCRSLDS